MTRLTSSLPILMLLLLSYSAGRVLKFANAQSKTWCVAKPSTAESELVANIQFACEAVGEKCRVMDPGGSCYNPNTPIYHASVAMNMYYQMMGRNKWNCDFKGTGLITLTDPSYGTCYYG